MIFGQAIKVCPHLGQQHQRQVKQQREVGNEFRLGAGSVGHEIFLHLTRKALEASHRQFAKAGEDGGDVAGEERLPVAYLGIARVIIVQVATIGCAKEDKVGGGTLINAKMGRGQRGQATLRLALCATGARAIDVTVNDQPAGRVARLVGDGAIARHSSHGLWYERELAFDASLLEKGTNVLKLIIPAGPVNNGVIYDYLRLELNED